MFFVYHVHYITGWSNRKLMNNFFLFFKQLIYGTIDLSFIAAVLMCTFLLGHPVRVWLLNNETVHNERAALAS